MQKVRPNAPERDVSCGAKWKKKLYCDIQARIRLTDT